MPLVVLLLCLAMSFSTANASIKTWWVGFCERNLVANDPETFEVATDYERTVIIAIYREIGAKAYWGDRSSRRQLKHLGDYLRAMDLQEARDALNDYGRFEK